MAYIENRYKPLPSYMTAKQLSVHIRRTSDSGYEPDPRAIHELLQKLGLKPLTKNGVQVYQTKNALRSITTNFGKLKEIENNIKRGKSFVANNIGIPNQKNFQYVPRKHGETNAMRELDKNTLYEKMDKKTIVINEERLRNIVESSIRDIITERVLGAGESFTEYTPEEKARNFEYLKTGFGRSAEERNPAYAAAKKAAEERMARRKEALEEDTWVDDNLEKQYAVFKKAIEIVKSLGYADVYTKNDNYFSFKVTVNGLEDAKKIQNALVKGLGADPYDISAQTQSYGNNIAFVCTVGIPGWNKLKQ